MEQEFEPLQFAVEKILPHGLFILAGSGKIGKSWLALDICPAVSSGGKLWDFAAEQGEALYLVLEDNYSRLQGRLKKIEAENTYITRLHLSTASLGISNSFLKDVWSGTATDLCNGLKTLNGNFNYSPAVLGKKLTASADFLEDKFGITADSGKKNKRFITLSRNN